MHGVRKPYEVMRDRVKFFWKKKFPNKHRKWGKNWVFGNCWKIWSLFFFWICSVMKVYTICSVPAQIPYLGKILFPRHGPKWSQPVRLKDFWIRYISITNWLNGVFLCMLIQIYENWNFIGNFFDEHCQKWVLPLLSQHSRIGCISRKNRWTELIFLHADANLGKLKVLHWFLGGFVQKWKWSFGLQDSKISCFSIINFWIEVIYCMLIVMQYFLVRLIFLLCIFNF